MPIYTYRCLICNYEEDFYMKSWRCLPPSCAHGKENPSEEDYEPMERIISKTSFCLKGDCWAKDGYSRGKK